MVRARSARGDVRRHALSERARGFTEVSASSHRYPECMSAGGHGKGDSLLGLEPPRRRASNAGNGEAGSAAQRRPASRPWLAPGRAARPRALAAERPRSSPAPTLGPTAEQLAGRKNSWSARGEQQRASGPSSWAFPPEEQRTAAPRARTVPPATAPAAPRPPKRRAAPSRLPPDDRIPTSEAFAFGVLIVAPIILVVALALSGAFGTRHAPSPNAARPPSTTPGLRIQSPQLRHRGAASHVRRLHSGPRAASPAARPKPKAAPAAPASAGTVTSQAAAPPSSAGASGAGQASAYSPASAAPARAAPSDTGSGSDSSQQPPPASLSTQGGSLPAQNAPTQTLGH